MPLSLWEQCCGCVANPSQVLHSALYFQLRLLEMGSRHGSMSQVSTLGEWLP
jgi:hypothetical protein